MSEPEAGLAPFPDGWERALVVVAHPDDIEWGGSTAVAAWTNAGKDVRYLLATRGEAGIAGTPPSVAAPLREGEQVAAATAVGVSDVTFLDRRDGQLAEGLDLRRDLARQIRHHQPQVVVTLSFAERWGSSPGAPWNSADHRALGRSAVDAVSDAGNEWIFPELAAEGYSPWAGVRWIAIAGSPQPTHAVAVDGHVDVGVASLVAHTAYLRALRPEDDDLEAYAREVVGYSLSAAVVGVEGPAVSFELLPGTAAD